MSDENERSVASAGSVAKDLADSLRGISDGLNVCGNDFSDILYPAARELERLDTLRLTDAECAELDGIISDFSEIAEFNEERCHPVYANKARRRVATLRGLLERLGGKR